MDCKTWDTLIVGIANGIITQDEANAVMNDFLSVEAKLEALVVKINAAAEEKEKTEKEARQQEKIARRDAWDKRNIELLTQLNAINPDLAKGQNLA